MTHHQLLVTRFVPPHQHPDGHVFAAILANISVNTAGVPSWSLSYPYTVRVSRNKEHVFNHGCFTIEVAQGFLEQHKHGLELIAPEGKVRAFYADENGRQYFYMGRSYKDEPRWRPEEDRAKWLTPSEFAAVVEEAAKGTWTRDKTIHRHAPV